jgi:hypothetical protein
MARLAGELHSAEFAALHPVVQAAYSHYALTAIHPFADGNGRLARTIASLFLMRAVGVPLLIFADQWPSYYQALGYHARGSAYEPAERQVLADYVSTVAFGAMDLAANLVAPLPSGAGPAQRPRRLRTPDVTMLDDAARALLGALSLELRDLLVSPPPGLHLAVAQTRSEPADHAEGAYRIVADDLTGHLGLRVAIRAAGEPDLPAADLEFVALVSELPGELLPIALRETKTKELLEVASADVYPLVLEPVVVRVRLWAQRLLAEALAPVLPPGASLAAPRLEADADIALAAR